MAADTQGEPVFLMVLAATEVACRRDDGVLVTSLARLTP